MKNSFYFDHDYSARNDQKILKLRFKYGLEGYGLFWCLIESMAEDSTGYIDREAIGGLSLGYGLPITRLLEIIEYCVKIDLLQINESGYYNNRILEHKKIRKSFKEKGIEGAKKRWKNHSKNSPPNSPPNAKDSIGKDSIGKEKKEINTSVPSEPIAWIEFYKQYPGTKSKKKDWENFSKKYKSEINEILPLLSQSLQREIDYHKYLKENNQFCPEWKNLSTWINNRCWEQEFVYSKPDEPEIIKPSWRE